VLGEKGEGGVNVLVGKVEVPVVGEDGRKKIRRVEEVARVVERGENAVKGSVVKAGGSKVREEGVNDVLNGKKATVDRLDDNNMKQ